MFKTRRLAIQQRLVSRESLNAGSADVLVRTERSEQTRRKLDRLPTSRCNFFALTDVRASRSMRTGTSALPAFRLVFKLCSYLRTSLNNRLLEALHLFQLRAALQQQQIDSGR